LNGTETSQTRGIAWDPNVAKNKELLAGLVIAYSAEIKNPVHIEKIMNSFSAVVKFLNSSNRFMKTNFQEN
jgi:hypothetical protein